MAAPPTGRASAPVRSADTWCSPITGFRALAAVAVAVAHSFLSARTYPLSGIVQIIGVIVPMFFVVSAYALYRPFVVEQLNRVSPTPARHFWWNRFLRIYPLYFVALTAYLVLLPPLRPPGGAPVDYLKLYTFLQVYDPDLSRFSGIPAAWFLCDEVAFYLMIPFLAALAHWIGRRFPRGRTPAESILRGHITVALSMYVIGFVARPILVLNDVPAATALPISNFDFYGIGILIAVATLWERQGLPLPEPIRYLRERPWLAVAGLVLGAAIIQMAATDPANWTREQDVLRYLMWTVMSVPVMVFLILGDQRAPANRWMGDARWTWLAVLSLHVYLWHQLLLGTFDRHVTEIALLHVGPRFTTGLLIALTTAVATIALAAALRPALDWPYHRWSGDRHDQHARRRGGRGRGRGGQGRRPGPADAVLTRSAVSTRQRASNGGPAPQKRRPPQKRPPGRAASERPTASDGRRRPPTAPPTP